MTPHQRDRRGGAERHHARGLEPRLDLQRPEQGLDLGLLDRLSDRAEGLARPRRAGRGAGGRSLPLAGRRAGAASLAEEARAALARALDGLSHEQRSVLVLTYFHDLPYAEIAVIVGCPVDTVKTRAFHGRRRLRALLVGRSGGLAVKARVLHLDSDQHLAAQILLPWYANATLDAGGAGELRGAPRRNARAARPTSSSSAASPPTRRRFRPCRSTAAGSPCAPASMRRRRKTAMPRRAPAAGPGAGCRSPSALQAVLALILATAWLVSSPPGRVPHPGDAASVQRRRTRSSSFARTPPRAEIRQALRAADARIVGGPTVTDAWLLRLAGPGRRLARAPAGRARGRPGRVARRRADAMRALILAAALCGFAAAAGAAEPAPEAAAPGAEAQQQVLVLLRLPPAHFRADGNYASGYADASGRAARRRSPRRWHAPTASPWPRPGRCRSSASIAT